MTAIEAHEPPQGLLGFRPVARLRTADGRQVAPGRLFRSATPQFVGADAARRFVDAVGLRTIIDLRLPREVRKEGSGGFAGTGARIVNVPFAVRETVRAESAVAPMTSPDPLVGTYLGYLADGSAFRRVIETLLAADGLPALVHCTLGKDRTGVAYAILLDALGILRADIAADYARSTGEVADMMNRLRDMASYGDDVAVYPPEAYSTSPANVLRFLAWVDLTFGGSRSYLESAGVGAAALDELAAKILEPGEGAVMTQVTRSITLDASAEETWRVVGDVANVHRWVPALIDTTMDADIRTVTFADGAPARERVLARSDEDRTYTYTYLDGPIPLDEYFSTLSVGPHHHDRGALVTWTATLAATPEVVQSVDEMYRTSLARLEELLG
ncbi:tyrosine-protein phosphatase [Nocardia higoensis]|uniref:tyrosine-protein phosphatase n=1 Tax=Nocardia higoensis TaxID=228599 RepID=UPI000311BF61|nr:tyrosine-protein phosphatase [Nocardia higoensis]